MSLSLFYNIVNYLNNNTIIFTISSNCSIYCSNCNINIKNNNTNTIYLFSNKLVYAKYILCMQSRFSYYFL